MVIFGFGGVLAWLENKNVARVRAFSTRLFAVGLETMFNFLVN